MAAGQVKTASITAENTFTDSLGLHKYFNISISGMWTATVTVQRSFDFGVTWLKVDTFTANTEEYGFEPEDGVLYRAGVETGNYTNGTIVLRLSQ